MGGPVNGEQSHLSIGEVLALLQQDFPDVTISKIRFLEAQGLLDPERSPSGYRKFREDDIERIRWILTQQRDHFLPLKVIKDRLASGDLSTGVPEGVLPLGRPTDGPVSTAAHPAARSTAQPGVRPDDRAARSAMVGQLVEGPIDRLTAASESVSEPIVSADGHRRHPATGELGDRSDPPVSGPSSGAHLSIEDLSRESGLSLRDLGDLERFGLISTRSIGQVTYYDDEALIVARLAAGFHRHGIETRHLRMFKVGAEREAALFEQLITPLLRKRTAEAREQAVTILEDLAELADDLRASMVRTVLREYLGTP